MASPTLLTFIEYTPELPGVYRMYGAQGQWLYVGKAKNLRKRLQSYFNKAQNTKTLALVSQIDKIEYTVTRTEVEALLLEQTLIKQHQPRYNILLKDDKSYPYLKVTVQDAYPRMELYRGSRHKNARFFGPYPSAYAARRSLYELQKIFTIRSCSDTFFKNRSRPCLQYQIKRCTAPCVGYISSTEYAVDVKHLLDFLEGRTENVVTDLVGKMNEAAEKKQYERAAAYRDQIQSLQTISQSQHMQQGENTLDVCVVLCEGDQAWITQFFIREGEVVGHLNHDLSAQIQEPAELLFQFMAQYYLSGTAMSIPRTFAVNQWPEEKDLLEKALQKYTGHAVKMIKPTRGHAHAWIEMALKNAQDAMMARSKTRDLQTTRMQALSAKLGISSIMRMECFDIAHLQGSQTRGACVVFDENGPLSSEYRLFKMQNVAAGDDYGALREVLSRHYQKRKSADLPLPDLVIIDGGPGQLGVAVEVLESLQLQDLGLLAISKGPDRRPGEEQIWIPGKKPMHWASDSPALHALQRIRDEAHRFAITGHRRAREKQNKTSKLEEIPGIGPRRRQVLLQHFGGLKGLQDAPLESIAKVPGISHTLAEKIFQSIHGAQK